jgi:hypothetical protein
MANSTNLTQSRAVAPAESNDPDVIQRQIDHTRAQLAMTVTAIGDRLSPENLIEQAKTTAKEAAVGRIKDMRNEANRRVEEVSGGVGQTIRENPLPVAVIGLGLGWLWLAGRNRQDNYRMRGNYTTSGYRYYEGDGPNGGYRGNYGRGYSDYEMDERGGLGRRMEDARDRVGEMAYDAAQMVDQRAGQMKQSVGSAAHDAGETVGDMAQRAGSAISDAADRVGQTVSGAAERVGEMGQNVSQTVGERAGMAQERLGQAVDHTLSEAERLRHEAQWRSQMAMERTKQSFWSSMDANPLAVGAVLALAGAAIGASIPATEYENRLLGETRDKLMDEARSRAQDTMERVQSVVEDTQRAAMAEVKDAAQRQNLPIGTGEMESGGSGSTSGAGSTSGMSRTGSTGSTGSAASSGGTVSTGGANRGGGTGTGSSGSTGRTGGSPDVSGTGTSAGPGSSGGSSVSKSGDTDVKAKGSTGNR